MSKGVDSCLQCVISISYTRERIHWTETHLNCFWKYLCWALSYCVRFDISTQTCIQSTQTHIQEHTGNTCRVHRHHNDLSKKPAAFLPCFSALGTQFSNGKPFCPVFACGGYSHSGSMKVCAEAKCHLWMPSIIILLHTFWDKFSQYPWGLLIWSV